MVTTTEIAPEIYRLAIFVPEINLEFSHFLVRDDEPLLFHAGLRGMFPLLREAISRLIDLSKLKHIGFSHFESDECGALNQWLELAPDAQPVCGLVGAMVSVNDFSIRPARVLTREDILPTGRYRFRFLPTPHVPHGWDAGVLFEEKERTLFCSDLFHQWGHREPSTKNDILERCRDALRETEAGPFANYVPYTHHTGRVLESLAEREPKTLAVMHGSSYYGNGHKHCEIWLSSCARCSVPKDRAEKRLRSERLKRRTDVPISRYRLTGCPGDSDIVKPKRRHEWQRGTLKCAMPFSFW